MFNVGTAELLVVLAVALLVLGPNKLPDAARQVGRALAELRRLSSGFQAEMRDALREPVDGTPRSASSTGATPSPPPSPATATPPRPGPGGAGDPAAQPGDASVAGAGGQTDCDAAAAGEDGVPAVARREHGDDGRVDEGAHGASTPGGGPAVTPPARDPGANGTSPA